MEEFTQGIPTQDSPVGGTIQGKKERQDEKGEPPDSQVEEFTRERIVEGSIQGRQDRKDLKGEPPDSQVEEFAQGIQSQDSPVEIDHPGRA